MLTATVGWPTVAAAQPALTLAEAMARARQATPEAAALDAALGEAEARVTQARAGYFPRVDVAETVQRGNQPVFAFSSLLSQRRFTESDFAIDALNHPDPITNVRTSVIVEQSVFDSGQTQRAVRRAEIGRELAVAGRAGVGQDLALAAARHFVRVLQVEAEARASRAAVEAAESDLQRARDRRDVGVVTDADVLAMDVHLALVRERRITAETDLAIARMQLNEAIGAPLDEMVPLVRPALPNPAPPAGALVAEAQMAHPDRLRVELESQLAESELGGAQAAYLPRVSLQGGWEANGSGLTDQRSAWIVGAQVQVNVFRGFGDSARVAEARHAQARVEAERTRLGRDIEVAVRTALARLEAARAREAVGRAALAQARESQRITRDRYDTGLATITDVLRAAEAALDAEARATAAELDVIIEAVALDRAVGRL